MEHINDIEFIEYVSGRLSSERIEEIQKHIAVCKQCSDHQRAITQLWNKLGQWEVHTDGHNISNRVMAKVEKSQQKTKISPYIKHRDFWMDILRAAALIIIAVGVGQKLGTISASWKPTPVKSAISQTEPKYIASFGLEWSSELAWLMMEDDTSVLEQ